MEYTKGILKRTGYILWDLLSHCALTAAVVGAAGLLEMGLYYVAIVFKVPFSWLSGAVLAAGAVWWIVDMVRLRRTEK